MSYLRIENLILLAILGLLVAGCSAGMPAADSAPTPIPSPALSMKGYELYSWREDGIWYFALVLGTNRIKTYQEIVAPTVRLEGFETLLNELDRLPGGEQVFWLVDRVPNMTLPPDEMVDAIAAHCTRLGVHLEIVR